ncbi:hypothetical protein ACFL1E_02945 [Candidatus Omnitrophota bacterium]
MHTKTEKLIAFFIIACIGLECVGCAALKKKFTRKPKGKKKKTEDVVLIPEEYPIGSEDPEVRYKTHYLIYKAWHNELMLSLTPEGNRKRLGYCFEGILLNLEQMKGLLTTQKRKEIQVHIDAMVALRDTIDNDGMRSVHMIQYADTLDRIRKEIKLNFSYQIIGEFIVRKTDDS